MTSNFKNTLKNSTTIALKDFRGYFSSPLAYIVIAFFMLIMGWMFFYNLSYFNMQSMQFSQYNPGKGPTLTEGVIRPFYGNMNVIWIFLVPVLTMSLFAQERKEHTLEFLICSPVTLFEMVFGKFLAAFGMVSVMIALTLIYPAILFIVANPDPGPIIGNYLGMLLLTSCYIAIGVACSAATDSQIVAYITSFAVIFFFWLISWASQSAGPVWGEFLNYMSLIGHYYQGFSRGLVNSTDVVYYFSVGGFALLVAHRILDSYRWR
jgi:ABC-2 type transport system permease protein